MKRKHKSFFVFFSSHKQRGCRKDVKDQLHSAVQEEIDLSAGAEHAGLLVVFSLAFCVHFVQQQDKGIFKINFVALTRTDHSLDPENECLRRMMWSSTTLGRFPLKLTDAVQSRHSWPPPCRFAA